jgi:hypothetical protein
MGAELPPIRWYRPIVAKWGKMTRRKWLCTGQVYFVSRYYLLFFIVLIWVLPLQAPGPDTPNYVVPLLLMLWLLAICSVQVVESSLRATPNANPSVVCRWHALKP